MVGELPDCGLYRSGMELAGAEEQVAAGRLIYFHNHSEGGPPLVLTPHANENNRWQFHERGWIVEDADFLESLVPLKPEGLYVNTRHLHVTREEIIPGRTLVQLGYNRSGEGILFIGRFEGNSITFPTKGYALRGTDVLEQLAPAGFNVPGTTPPESLH